MFARWSSSRELELQYPYQTSSRSIQPVASFARPLCVFTNLAIFQSLMILCKDYKARPAQASGVAMTHIGLTAGDGAVRLANAKPTATVKFGLIDFALSEKNKRLEYIGTRVSTLCEAKPKIAKGQLCH